MPAHDWKRTVLPDDFLGNVTDLLKFSWLPVNPVISRLKVWRCGRCGALVAASGLMSQSDARRRAKIPFDCHLQMVRSVHSF